MIELSEELIQTLTKDNSFREFEAYVVDKIEELDSVGGLLELNNQEAGETAKVRALTAIKLKEILAPFFNFVQKVEHSPEQIHKAKQRAGL